MKAKLRRLRRFLALIVGATAAACSVSPAEKATYQAIGPEYVSYIQEDKFLSSEQKQRRLDLVESWRQRVEAAK